ncbi:SusC/RagA family TonB-linked outer membrane protein [Salinibacter ruber]|uniref:SusC/RagA family TonB-linked outer membrane protein n=1 Tax=Salinibacter ruber TaxID=146919 RepID=UPI0021676018|nr:SusC/RagA family TonB-linked outer membrane protein [Salinibacter ruber]MCS3644947.1 TonB-linked SusC/RagA family outer membrane protein [Salinibacter ruber]MCS4150182.1 TonB-linked SusC/RagA family outer membrane protein [Salinibacter ruber]
MKRLIPSVVFGLALLLLPGLAWAQQGTVTGMVMEAETENPLPGATIQVVDLGTGAAADSEGSYSLKAPAGEQTIRVSFVGYQAEERTINVPEGGTVRVNFRLQTAEAQLDEVVVSALGQERRQDQLGAGLSSIEGAAVEESGDSQVIQSLAAKASGLNIKNTGGGPGAGASIVIRGRNTIQGDNQPLIVVDGTPISNANFGEGTGGVTQQSRLNDINPNDIASVEVLKGAAAAGLWGSRAQSGVIVIETKSGGFESDTQVSFETSVTGQVQARSVDLQESYGRGNNGFFQFTPASGFSWGDRIADRDGGEDEFRNEDLVAVGEQTGREYRRIPNGGPGNPHGGKNSRQTFDHSENLFDTGLRTQNNLSISGGGEKTRYRLSGSYTFNDGILPGNSNYERTTARLKADRQVSDALTVSGNVNFVRSASDRVQGGSNISGLLLAGYRTPADFRNADYEVTVYPDGLEGAALEDRHRAYRSAGIGTGAPVYDNPLWTANNVDNTSVINRTTGNVEANYEPLSWLNFTGRVGVDEYTDRRQEYFPIRNASIASGQTTEEQISETRVNVDLQGTASRSLIDGINADLTLGGQFNHREFDNVGGSLNDFSNPTQFRSLSNAVSENVSAFTSQSTERTLGVFSELSLDFYDQAFVTLRGRADQSSTFGPEADDTYYSPSAQINWHVHKTLLPDVEALSFLALRGSVGKVGRQPGPYLSFTTFSSGAFFDGFTGTTLEASGYNGGFERGNNLGNASIEAEETIEYEGGLDVRLFDDAVSLSGTYYWQETSGAIFSVDTAPSSGFTSRSDNAAVIRNRGVELDLSFEWPDVGDFSWTTTARWWTNLNTVESLSGVSEVGLAGFTSATSSLIEGEEYGVFFGNRWARESFQEPTGDQQVGDNGRILNADGFPVGANTQGLIGNPNPDWRANIGNTFRYRNLSLNVLFDFKIGGDVWNGTNGALKFFGRLKEQAQTTTVSADKAQDLSAFNGSTIAELASARGDVQQNDDGSFTFRGEVRDFGDGDVAITQSYFSSGPGSGFTGPAEPNIEEGDYVKLREVSLSYTFEGGFLQDTRVESIDLSATGRNLLIFSPYSGVDPEINLTGPSNGQGLDYFNNPTTRSFQFSARLTF